MRCIRYIGALSALVFVLGARGETEDLFDASLNQARLQAAVKERSAGNLLQESTAVKQAAATAKSGSEYGMELRPRVTDNDVGVALRIYLPNRWSQDKLRAQLSLVAESEQLRVAALEWQELLSIYRTFCLYRMLETQGGLYDAEISRMEPIMSLADERVAQNQLAVADRAKLYGLYLGLMNDRDQLMLDQGELAHRLHAALGHSADLDAFAQVAKVALPTEREADQLWLLALKHRADYRQLDANMRALSAAEAVARTEEGFRLKYIQPDYQVDYSGGGENSWGLSASFILPWGTHNSDISVYQEQQRYVQAEMSQQRQLILGQLNVLLQSIDTLEQQTATQQERVAPVRKQLEADLQFMQAAPLEQARDGLTLRKRLLDQALLVTKATCKKESLAVDLAELLGTF